jgi:hypothetical protein
LELFEELGLEFFKLLIVKVHNVLDILVIVAFGPVHLDFPSTKFLINCFITSFLAISDFIDPPFINFLEFLIVKFLQFVD